MDQLNQMINEIIREIKGVNFILDNLEVKGRQNMDIVIGAMQHLDQAVSRLGQVAHDVAELSKPIEESEPKSAPEE